MEKEDGVVSSNGNIIHLASIPTDPVMNVIVDVLAIEIAQGVRSSINRVHVRGSKDLIFNIVREQSEHCILEGRIVNTCAIPVVVPNIFGYFIVVDGACLKSRSIILEGRGTSSGSNGKFPLFTNSVRCLDFAFEILTANPSADLRT